MSWWYSCAAKDSNASTPTLGRVLCALTMYGALRESVSNNISTVDKVEVAPSCYKQAQGKCSREAGEYHKGECTGFETRAGCKATLLLGT